MRRIEGRPPAGGERRRATRWLDKRLATVQMSAGEVPGLTGDISSTGMRIGLPCVPAMGEGPFEVCVAFAQDVLTVQCELVYVRERPWGALVGVRYAAGQGSFRRFLSRRYCQPEDVETRRPRPFGARPYRAGRAGIGSAEDRLTPAGNERRSVAPS